LIRAGKVLYIGTSTFAAWQLVESLWVSRELGLNRFVCEQPPYNLLDRSIERELLPMARTYGFAIIPWSPIAGGLLTGKYSADKEPEQGMRFADRGNDVLRRRYTPAMFAAVERLMPIAHEKQWSLSRLALAWCMGQPGVTSPIIGPRTMEHLQDYLGAMELALTPEDLKKIDEAAPPFSVAAPYYQADFGPHPHRV
jgi:aryl-alcohol dehydrogenase-like predicted oxidoreductase